MAKTTYHHEELKTVLLEKAELLLEEHGLGVLSLRRIAREAGVSHAAPYRHFKNKMALISELARVGYLRILNSMNQVLEKYPDDPAKQFKVVGMIYVKMAVNNPEMANLMFGTTLSEYPEGLHNVEAVKAYSLLEKIIENGQKAGVFRKSDKSNFTLTVWSLVHGLAMLIIGGRIADITNIDKPMDVLVSEVLDTLQSGI